MHREAKENMFDEVSEREMMFFYAFVQYLSSTAIAGVYEPIQDYGVQVFNCTHVFPIFKIQQHIP